MRERSGIWRRVTIAGACTLLVSGCLTRQALYEDLAVTRDRAYASWRRVRERGDIPIPQEALTRNEAVRIALLYNKALQATIQEREIARGQLVSARRLALPRVDATAATEYGSSDADRADVIVRQPLFRGGGATAGLRAAKLYAFWSDERVRHMVQHVIRQVIYDYDSALLAENLCQVNRDAVTSAEAHLNDVRVKRVNGVASKYDALRARVDVANFRAELIRQENHLVLAKNNLLRTLGAATDAPIQLTDPLRHEAVVVTLEEALETAYINRPELYMAELNIRMQREKVKALRATYLPEIDLAMRAGSDRQRDGDDHWGGTQRAGIELNWNLFDGMGREGEIIAARALLKQREIELQRAEEDVFLDVQQALLNLANAEEYVESQKLNLEHAEEGLRLAMTGYREGVNTEIEVVDARSALTETRGNYYRALYDHSLARLALQQATGVLEKEWEAQ